MEMALCVFVPLYECVGWKRKDGKALSKKIFQEHFASVTLIQAVDWHALLDRNQSYQPICCALGMVQSLGRGLSGKWCCSRHSLSTTCVLFVSMWVLRMAKHSIKVLIEKPLCPQRSEFQTLMCGMYVCALRGDDVCVFCWKYKIMWCTWRNNGNGGGFNLNMISKNINAVKTCCKSKMWRDFAFVKKEGKKNILFVVLFYSCSLSFH